MTDDIVLRPGGGLVRRDTARKFTAAKRQLFLEQLADCANVAASARAVGVSSSLVYKRKATDPDFSEGWEAALNFGIDKLEMRLLEHALNGYDRPILWQGTHTGDVRAVDPKLMLALLNSHRAKLRARAASFADPYGAGESLEAKLDAMAERLAAPMPDGLVPWERAAPDGEGN